MNYFTLKFLTGTSYFFAISNKCSFVFFFFPLFQGLNLKRLESVQGGREVRKSKGEGWRRREKGFSVALMWWVMLTDADDDKDDGDVLKGILITSHSLWPKHILHMFM